MRCSEPINMDKMRLGCTNIYASRSGFGGLPIQRINQSDALRLLRKAYDNGINFYDTANAYTDSEEKIGLALSDVRHNVYIATKSGASDRKTLEQHLETSLRNLRTDYIDILQLHNPSQAPDPDDANGLYAGLQAAKQKGLVRFIGITNHRLSLALAAARSGLYDTVQFPLSSLSSDDDLELVKVCQQHDVGLIAMKALSGGLITNAATTFAFLRQFENVLPIWGIQYIHELDEFIALEKNPPVLDETTLAVIARDRAELAGNFCRACGYCLPCPVGIPIPMAARMMLLLRRMPPEEYITSEWQERMELIDQCLHCGQCQSRCPYGLNTPLLLEQTLKSYREYIKGA